MKRTCIVSTTGNNHVGELLRGTAELLEGWLHEQHILAEHLVQIAAAFVDVAGNATGESCVTVCVDEKFHVEQLTNFWKVEDENAFEQDDVSWVNRDGLIRADRVRAVIVRVDCDLLALENINHRRVHCVFIEGIGMVEVEAALLRADFLLVGQFSVEAVLTDRNNLKQTNSSERQS